MTRNGIQRGKLITFEGIDGAGKSTHIAATAELLRARGLTVLCTREPGGTPIGEKLRDLLLKESMSLETETLLMFAARQEHVLTVILPALERGEWVLCDRFSDASYAYQGGGRGLPKEKFELLEEWVHGYLHPDLTLLFDLPPLVAEQRIRAQDRTLDRFEQEKSDFHVRVRNAYLERSAAHPERFRLIDAKMEPENVKKQVEENIISICL